MSELAAELGRRLAGNGEMLALAESCTGGLISRLVTDVPGSSGWFERGMVTYSNESKRDLLGVSADLIARHGSVSRECAEAMAAGLMVMTPAHWGVAVTGIAGPGGGSPEKPVGLVWIAWVRRDRPVECDAFQFGGSRAAIREAAAETALKGLLERMGSATA